MPSRHALKTCPSDMPLRRRSRSRAHSLIWILFVFKPYSNPELNCAIMTCSDDMLYLFDLPTLLTLFAHLTYFTYSPGHMGRRGHARRGCTLGWCVRRRERALSGTAPYGGGLGVDRFRERGKGSARARARERERID